MRRAEALWRRGRAILLGALGLRLWGIRPRPALRLQRRRERALRAARDRDVRALATTRSTSSTRPRSRTSCTWRSGVRWGGRGPRSGTRSRPTRAPRSRSRACSRRCSGAASGRRCWRGRARGSSTGASGSSPRAAGRRLPARALRAPGGQRRARAGAAVPEPGRDRRRLPRRAAARLRARGRGARRCLRDQVHGGDRAAGARSRRRARDRSEPLARAALAGACGARGRSWSPTRTRCSTSTCSATGSRASRRHRATAAASSASSRTAASSTTLGTLTWGLGWLPALAAAGGAVGLAVTRPRGWRSCSSPRRCCSCSSWACRTASSRAGCCRSIRCCACSRRAARSRRCGRVPAPALVAAVLLCAQGLVFSVHNDLSLLARPTPAQLARDWMVANVPEGTKVVIEPIAPGPRGRWTSATRRGSPATATAGTSGDTSNFRGRRVKLEDYERTLSPAMLDRYTRAGYCIVLTGSTPAGPRAARAGRGAQGRRLLPRARAPRARAVPRQPTAGGPIGRSVLVRLLVQQLPARLRQTGPGDRGPPDLLSVC